MDLNPKEKLLTKLEGSIDDATNCARQIYYAKKLIDEGNSVGAQRLLNEALRYLGVTNPKDVGLSTYALGLKDEIRNSDTQDQNIRRNRSY